MKSKLTMLAIMGITATLAVPQKANACSSQPFVGQICTFAGLKCPSGMLIADGKTYHIIQYEILASVISNTYGGSPASGTFAVPNLQGLGVVGTGIGPNSETLSLAHKRGQYSTAMNSNNLPAHNHAAVFKNPILESTLGDTILPINLNAQASTTNGSATPSTTTPYLGAMSTVSGDNAFMWGAELKSPFSLSGVQASVDLSMAGLGAVNAIQVNVKNAGSAVPIQTQPPVMGITYCIAYKGTYPNNSVAKEGK